jgi:hypothetical protein
MKIGRRQFIRNLLASVAWLAHRTTSKADSDQPIEPREKEQQMAVFTLLNQRNRNAGTYASGEFDVPQGVQSFEARGLMEDAVVLDNTLVLSWRVEATWDGTNWTLLVGSGWQGGLDEDLDPVGRPNQTWQSSGPMPIKVRGEIASSKRAEWGLEIEVI